MDTNWLVGSALIGLIGYFSVSSFLKRRNLPPGPTGLPLVGYAPFIPWEFEDHFRDLFKRYGRIISFNLYGTDVVMIGDIEVIKKCMMRDSFNYRPNKWMFSLFGPPSMITWSGEEWKVHRKFALRIFKHLGLGKEVIESKIHDEIDYLFRKIEEEQEVEGEISRVKSLLGPSASNVVCLLVLGERLDFDNPLRSQMDFGSREGKPRSHALGFINYYTQLLELAFKIPSSKLSEMKARFQVVQDYVYSRIDYYKKNFDVHNDDVTNFIQAYLKELSDPTAQKQYFDDEHLFSNALSFLTAGSQTVKDFLEWFLQVMITLPEVQEKMRQELDLVVGKERRVAMSDKINLPYCEAVLWEVERHTSSSPIGIMHAVNEDVDLEGYTLPKGTHVIQAVFAVHSNPEYFQDPEMFKPERFLSDDGKRFMKSDKVINFGSGKRSCPGEPFARTEMFLYATAFVQKFKIEAPEGVTPTLEGYIDSFGRNPKQNVRCLFTKRN